MATLRRAIWQNCCRNSCDKSAGNTDKTNLSLVLSSKKCCSSHLLDFLPLVSLLAAIRLGVKKAAAGSRYKRGMRRQRKKKKLGGRKRLNRKTVIASFFTSEKGEDDLHEEGKEGKGAFLLLP